MSTLDQSNDFILNGVNNDDDYEVVIDPIIGEDNDDIVVDNDVHVIGGSVDDSDIAASDNPDAYIVDFDSDGVFDFAVADADEDGMIEDNDIFDISDAQLSSDDFDEGDELDIELDNGDLFDQEPDTQDFDDESHLYEDDFDDSMADGFDDFGF